MRGICSGCRTGLMDRSYILRVCVCVSIYSIYHTCLSRHSSFDFLMLIITSSCECCQSLLRFYTRHPERAVKLWFIAVTHLWGLCYTRFITIAAVKVHQEAKSSHHHHLTWADVVQPIKSNHYLMSNVTRINILHLSLPSVCRDVQLKRKKNGGRASCRWILANKLNSLFTALLH